MSVDRWTECPKCLKQRTTKLAEMRRRVEEAYGNKTPAEYEGMKQELELEEERDAPETFREDESCGVHIDDEGNATFDVSYRGRCTRCGFKFEFTHSENLKI